MNREDCAPRNPYDGPNAAHLLLAGGGKIECSIAEDPQRDARGMRVFLLQPARHPRPWETVTGAWIDRLPGKSVASVVWDGPPLPEGTAMNLSWHGADGTRYESQQKLGPHGRGQNWDGHPS